MTKGLRAFLLLTAGLSLLSSVFAESVILKSGQKIEGKIIEKTDRYIKIDLRGTTLVYYLEDIKGVEGNGSAAAGNNSAEAYNQLGLDCRINGRQEEAIVYFSKAIESDPFYTEAYRNRGLSYANSGIKEYDAAIADFNRAIELSPREGDLYFERALAYLGEQEYGRSLEDLQKSKALGLRYYSELYPQFLKQLKKDAAKEAAMSSALLAKNSPQENKNRGLDSANAEYYNNRAFAYYKEGKFEQAILDYDRAAQINPRLALAYANRANVYVSMENYDRAIADFNKAIGIKPDDPQSYNDRAMAYFFKKEYALAWKDAHKAEALGYNLDPEFIKELKEASKREK